MSGIHPISAVLLTALAVVALVGALVFAVRALRQRRIRRAQEPDEDIIIDLTYFHESTRLSREAQRQLSEGSAGRPNRGAEHPNGSG